MEKIKNIIAEMRLQADELMETAIDLNSRGWYKDSFIIEDQIGLLEKYIDKLELAVKEAEA